jgi:hypothetical protein
MLLALLLAASPAANPGQIGFTQDKTQASRRPLADKLADIVSVKDAPFNAKGDGVTDDTAAIQAAHDAFSGDGGTIYFPPTANNYKITGTLVFTKPIRLAGHTWASSTIASTTASLTWITTTAQIVVENMSFTATGAALNTAIFVKQLSTSAGHNGTTFHNNYLQGANKAYWAQRATEFHFDGNKCNNGAYCLYLENLSSSDEGDSFVSNNEFANSTSGIFVVSTSGLYISNNKFNGSATCHIDIAPTGAVGDYTIVGNSIEGHTACGVRLAGSFTNTKTLITGNQFSSAATAQLVIGNNAQNVTVTGNTFNDTSSAQGLGIDVQTGARNVTITGNAFHQILQAIQASSTVLGIDTSGNRFASDVTTYWTGEDSNSGQSAFGGSKMLGASREVVNNTPATYTDVFKVKGQCVLEIEFNGVVQGVGTGSQYTKVLLDGATPTITNIVAPVTSGAQFDIQVAAAGGYAVVSVRQHVAVGTSISMMVTVRVTGYPTGFLHA